MNEIEKEISLSPQFLNASDFVREAIRDKLKASLQYRIDKAQALAMLQEDDAEEVRASL